MSTENLSVVIRNDHTEAKHVVETLHRPGFDLQQHATAAKDEHAEQHTCPSYNLGNRIKRR